MGEEEAEEVVGRLLIPYVRGLFICIGWKCGVFQGFDGVSLPA